MNVAAILNTKGRSVVTAKPETTILEIAEKLTSQKIGAVVIMGSEGKVAGIFSERDITRSLAEHGPEALKQPASKLMTTEVITCEPSVTIDDMMETMTKGRFRHVPVIEDGALVGLVSIGDVVKHHIAEVELEVSAMRFYLNG